MSTFFEWLGNRKAPILLCRIWTVQRARFELQDLVSLLIQPKVRTSTRNGIFDLAKNNMYNDDQQDRFELCPIDPEKILWGEDLLVLFWCRHVSREPCYDFFFEMSILCLGLEPAMNPNEGFIFK